MQIVKTFSTETAHIVRNAFSRRCAFSIHGHNYVYEVCIEGDVQEDGMILDFKKLYSIKLFIDQMDHSTILWEKETDDIKNFFTTNFERVLIMENNPTAENMAQLLFNHVYVWLATFYADFNVKWVRIWETKSGSAICDSYNSNLKDDFVFISDGIENE